MKSKIEPKKFQPVTVSLTFEGQEEIEAFYLLMQSLDISRVKPTPTVTNIVVDDLERVRSTLFSDIAFPLLNPDLQ